MEPSEEQDGPHPDADLLGPDGRLDRSLRYDYAGRCWWCGGTADSGEHKYKRTDLVREFGGGPWTGGDVVAQYPEGEQPRFLQSPKADRLKFLRVLCVACNSSRSQLFDRAYDHFIQYVADNESQILRVGSFHWSAIFGHDWRRQRNNLRAYWLKHIGCRFAIDGVEVDRRIIAFLDQPANFKDVPMILGLEIREDIAAAGEHLRKKGIEPSSLWMGAMSCTYSRSQNRIHQAESHWGVRWLRLNYIYDLNCRRGRSNFEWDRVSLPRSYNLDPDQWRSAD